MEVELIQHCQKIAPVAGKVVIIIMGGRKMEKKVLFMMVMTVIFMCMFDVIVLAGDEIKVPISKLGRFVNSLKENLSDESYNKIIESLGYIDDNACPKMQAQYINDAISLLENTQEKEAVINALKSCGNMCISNNIIERAKKIYQESENIDAFLQLLNKYQIGGGHLRAHNGRITGEYHTCYCEIPKQVENMSPVYCYCSVGWYERFFSSVFNKPVTVNIIDTILNGNDKCVFEVIYDDETIE